MIETEGQDINDLFDNIVLAEENLSEQSYREGFREGEKQGKEQGYELGMQKGLELGEELGNIYGTTVGYLQLEQPPKLTKALQQIRELIEDFPLTNDSEEDIISDIQNIRTQYKKIKIRQRIDTILAFLNPFWELVNCHMVNYITENHWEHFMPQKIKDEISSSSLHLINECIEKVFWSRSQYHSSQFPAVSKFIENSRSFYLEYFPEIITPVEKLYDSINTKETSPLPIKDFLTEKKRHEVEITAELIDKLIKYQQSLDCTLENFIIDAGDGKGYLSSRLALEFKHSVLGIDLNEMNTESALQRNKKLERAWNALTERAALENKGIHLPRRGKKTQQITARKTENYKTTNRFITTKLDFVQLLHQSFHIKTNETPSLCLAGLHTCGNLAPTCLQIFAMQDEFKILCNIGCCYHLLKEEFIEKELYCNNEIMNMQNEPGFPMSQYLRNSCTKIGRNARMLAAQSVHRTIERKELPNISLFYRALFEKLLMIQYPPMENAIQVGKIRKFTNFKEYTEECCKKLNLSLPTEVNLLEFEASHAHDAKLLNLFYLIRMTFAPVVESLILLDRLLFLKENSIERSFLVPLFDPVISPRHYCIVALRK